MRGLVITGTETVKENRSVTLEEWLAVGPIDGALLSEESLQAFFELKCGRVRRASRVSALVFPPTGEDAPPRAKFLRLLVVATALFGLTLGISAASPGGSSERRGSASTDGTIAYTDSETIHLIRPDGRAHRTLRGVQGAGYPTWRPDARQIAFIGTGVPGEIFVVNVDGTGLRRLTRTRLIFLSKFDLAWSPDGKRIAYTEVTSVPSEEGTDIVVINPDGSGRKNLTNTPEDHDSDPTWSPDSTKIAYDRTVGSFDPGSGLVVMNADGSAKRLVSEGSFNGLDWSPDGTRFAFCTTLPGRLGPSIFVINADGTGRRQLTAGCWPTWSPDGARIAFRRSLGATARAIYIVNANGVEERLVVRPNHSVHDPDWGIDPPPLSCRVPRVIALRISTARRIVRRAKCSLGSIRSARSKRPRGVVIRQSPKPGVRLLANGRISIVVSRGPR